MSKKLHKGTRLPKEGVDNYGRTIYNSRLYKHTSNLTGVEESLVENIIMFVGNYTKEAIRSGMMYSVMIPGFGKFMMNKKLIVEKDRKKIHYSTLRLVSPISKAVLDEMVTAGLVKRIGLAYFNVENNLPVTFKPFITVDNAIDMYKNGIYTKEVIRKIFEGKNQDVVDAVEHGMKDVDYYRKKTEELLKEVKAPVSLPKTEAFKDLPNGDIDLDSIELPEII